MRRRMLFRRRAGSLVLAMIGAHLVTGQESAKKPNVLFIAVDDLNDWIGCLGGHPDAQTPHIDRLAKRGVLFERAYCSAPLCNPSRASLLTGYAPSTTGVYRNPHLWRQSEKLKNAATIPQHFMANGYHVVGGGKIFHGGQQDPQSWQFYFNKGRFPQPKQLPGSGVKGLGNLDWGPVDAADEDLKDTNVADWAAKELNKKHEKPFFIACGIFRPHLPWYAPRKYFDRFPPDKITLPTINEQDLDDVPPIPRKWVNKKSHEKIVSNGKWREAVAAYLACSTYADACIGRVLDALDRSPYKDSTIVVFWCDHGWHLAEKLHWKKFTLWEEATRVPMAIHVPGMTKPGGRCGRTVSLLDLYPTLIDLCGLTAKPELEGRSLVPLLKNPAAAWERPAVTTYQLGNHSVRSERWRYTRYRDGTEELYDHEKDPLEWTNLAKKPAFTPVKDDLKRWLPKIDAPEARKKGAARRKNRQAKEKQ